MNCTCCVAETGGVPLVETGGVVLGVVDLLEEIFFQVTVFLCILSNLSSFASWVFALYGRCKSLSQAHNGLVLGGIYHHGNACNKLVTGP